ncbi:MAG: Fis family transcriptional regulator [Dehalococcoidales bacterium]|nr:Fis family transcriptional regulator [Dehalococcoidales bacterium]|tara:strand:+ start:2514 stop:3326 length:813 start_codon:yes stop_codon:yes gene_type:complete
MLIEDLIASLESGLDRRPLTIAQVCIGVFYTVVELSDGQVGAAFTPRDMEDTVCCPRSAAELPEAGKLSGQSAWDMAQQALSPSRLCRSVGLATLNALSACLMAEKDIPGGRLLSNTDALDVAHIDAGDKVAMVGAFTPFIRKLKKQDVDLKIIDKHREALKGKELSFWVSPDSIAKVMPEADVAIITGSAMVEGGLDGLLELCKGAHEVVLAGPTASPWPEPFFARGVTVMGGIRVKDSAEFMRLVAEGGSGYFFSGPAEKIAIVKDKK